MKTKLTFSGLLLSFLILAGTINAQKIEEVNFFKNNPDLGGEVIIDNSTNEIIDNESYTSFSVRASSDGDYHLNFWLMPAKLKDESYSTYNVLINGQLAGKIVPKKGNWQAIGINNRKTVRLNKGDNIISVVVQMPEVPAVEFVRLAKNANRSVIPSTNFDNYLNKCKTETAINQKNQRMDFRSLYGDTLNNSITTRSSGTFVWYDAPVSYTFYTKLRFYAGQEIFVTSASKVVHFIEFFNADMPQYLSWVHRSEYTVNGGNYVATVKVTIPQDGYYYVRARTYKNYSGSTANININGNHYYENATIYTFGKPKIQGGNNTYYASFTKNTNADPFLLIGGQADRIVAYNDDVKSSDSPYASPHGVSGVNSFIRENFSMPTDAVFVTAYSSYRSGTCDLYAGVSTSQTRSISLDAQVETRSSSTENSQIELLSQTKVYPNSVVLNSDLNITSGDLIETIEIYSLSGQKLNSIVINENQVKLSLSDLKISQTGMYIVKIKTTSGVKTEKVIVN